MSCLIVLSHSFRINSRLFKKALTKHNKLAVVYPSPWYFSSSEREVLKRGSCQFHKKAINLFASDLKSKLGLDLFLIKSDRPKDIIVDILKENDIEEVFYDMPLFGPGSWIDMSGLDVTTIDSDSHDPECIKMTAKSRWVYWLKNKKSTTELNCENVKGIKLNLPKVKPDKEKAENLREEITKLEKRFEQILPKYHQFRNHKEGSSLFSKYLHHGLIDANEILSGIINMLPGFIQKDHPIVPFLRQMAFREISIRKTRINDLSFKDPVELWAERLLDKKSYDNLITPFPGKFTREQFLSATTGNTILDNELKRLIESKWAPNRIRMWLASQCYYGMGGGIESLKTIIDLFNYYSDDGQSPNNYISCVSTMRMQYGKVMNYNTKRTFKLVNKF